jgi:putative addiction module component (TIGR02574 family)
LLPDDLLKRRGILGGETMTPVFDEIVNAALALPIEERAKLAKQILVSLETSQAQIDEAWRDEIERRIREIDQGEVELLPGEEVLKELRTKFRS